MRVATHPSDHPTMHPTGERIDSPLQSQMVEQCTSGATDVAHFFPTHTGYVVTLLFECTA